MGQGYRVEHRVIIDSFRILQGYASRIEAKLVGFEAKLVELRLNWSN